MAMQCLVAAAMYGVALAQGQTPQILADTSNNLQLQALAGDVWLATGGQACTSTAPCALGASLSTMQSQIDALNQASNMYLTQTDAASTYVPQTSMNMYATRTYVDGVDAATRQYVLQQIANATGVPVGGNGTGASSLSSAIALGLVDPVTLAYLGNIQLSGEPDIVSMHEVLDAIRGINGYLRIYSLNHMTTLDRALFSQITYINGSLTISSCSGLVDLGAAFPNLVNISGSLSIQACSNLVNITSAFPNLQYVGGSVSINSNARLPSIAGFLPRVTMIGGSISMSNNILLNASNLNGAFGALRSLNGITITSISDLYIGNVYCDPRSRYNAGTPAQVAAMLANKRMITGSVYINNQPTGTTLPANFLSNIRSIGGTLYVQQNYFASLDGVLSNVERVGGVYLYYNRGLTTWGTFLQSLVMSGTIQIRNNQNTQFTSLDGIFPNLRNCTGYMYIQYNYYVTSMNGAFAQLRWLNSRLYISYNRALAGMDATSFPLLEYAGGITFIRNYYRTNGVRNLNGIFPNVTTVGPSGLYIYYEYQLQSATGMFPRLNEVQGYMYMYYNTILRDMSNSFASLRSIRYNLYMYRNYQLTGVTNIFPVLNNIGRTLNFYLNGCSRSSSSCQSFCQAVQSQFCPAAGTVSTSSYLYGGSQCCNAFCATSNLC